MRWLYGITRVMDMDLGKLWEMARNREAWSAAVHGVTKVQTWLGDWKTILSYVLSMPTFWEVFIINGCLILSKPFPVSLRWLSGFHSSLCWYMHHIGWLADIEKSLHPWAITCITRPLCMILLMAYWIWFARILLTIFVSILLCDIGR